MTVIDTGETTMTGGRIKRAASHIGEETFCLTDGELYVPDRPGSAIRRYSSTRGRVAGSGA